MQSAATAHSDAVVDEQKALYEASMKESADAMAEERRRGREDVEALQTEISRTMTRLDRMQLDHDKEMEFSHGLTT